MRTSMPGRRSEPGSASATRRAAPETLQRLAAGLGRAGWAFALAGPDGRLIWANEPMLALVGATAGQGQPDGRIEEHFTQAQDVSTGVDDGVILMPRAAPGRYIRALQVPWEDGTLHMMAECTREVEREKERRQRDIYLSRAVEDSVDAVV